MGPGTGGKDARALGRGDQGGSGGHNRVWALDHAGGSGATFFFPGGLRFGSHGFLLGVESKLLLGTVLEPKVWRLLPQVDGKERPVQYEPPSVEFIHERLRELSKKPLPIWPIVLLVYITCPLLVFVVIPAAIDLYWLLIGPQVPLSLLIDSQEEDVREKDPWNSSCEATLRKLTDKLPHSDCNEHASMFHGIRKCKTM